MKFSDAMLIAGFLGLAKTEFLVAVGEGIYCYGVKYYTMIYPRDWKDGAQWERIGLISLRPVYCKYFA